MVYLFNLVRGVVQRLACLRFSRRGTSTPRALASWGLTLWLLSLAAQAAPDSPRTEPFPQLDLRPRLASKAHTAGAVGATLRGAQAVTALGADLERVARWYGMPAKRLSQALLKDTKLRVDMSGRLLFVDELTAPTEAADPPTPAENADLPPPFPLERTFFLHSQPRAARTIYLNFQGARISGTAWNDSTGLSVIDAAPFDLDGNPSHFNDSERAFIQRVWLRVAEDFAPFQVDVTTEEPAPERIARTNAQDTEFGTVVMITRYYLSALGKRCGCAGVAYLSVFDSTSERPKPAWVFFDELSRLRDKPVAEAVSHEAGHNAGLGHDGYDDGTRRTDYYRGHGSGAVGWAPIMGLGYFKDITQWSKGEYPFATQDQDDYAVMQANGLPPRVDDHHAGLYDATALRWINTGDVFTLAGEGIISTPDDVDAFSFYSGAGDIALSVSVAPLGSNLDLRARLFDAGGRMLALSSPAESLVADLRFTATQAGFYYLKVDGVGLGTPTPGYSDYGSLGQYRIAGSVPSATGNLPPVARITASAVKGVLPFTLQLSAAASFDPEGSALTYRWTFGDGTPEQSSVTTAHLYTQPGTYTVRLSVWDAQGLRSSAVMNVQVSVNRPPVALASASVTQGLSPLRVTFSGGNSVEPDGEALTYQWDFGDGTPSATTPDVVHGYRPAGVHRARLTVRDPQGLESSTEILITVINQPPSAFATPSVSSGTAPLKVNFDNRGTADPERETLRYEWNFGDGSPIDSDPTPSHIYSAPGQYITTLTVRDPHGASASATLPIEVKPTLPPVAVISATPTAGVAPLTVQFSSTGSDDPEGERITYEWNFGDGTPVVTNRWPTHSFLQPGRYTVTLTVRDKQGAQGSAAVYIDVRANP